MKKVNILTIVISAFAVIFFSVVFHAYGYGGQFPGSEGNWRDYEWLMYIGTVRAIVVIAGVVSITGLISVTVVLWRDGTLYSRSIFGILLIAISILTVVGFTTMFYPCIEMAQPANRPMRCVWTMRSMNVVLGVIAFCGILMIAFNKSRDIVKGLFMSASLSIMGYMLIPVFATGVCLAHICTYRFRPFSMVMGIILISVAVFGFFSLFKNGEDNLDEIC